MIALQWEMIVVATTIQQLVEEHGIVLQTATATYL
jgi:hypothetical protein